MHLEDDLKKVTSILNKSRSFKLSGVGSKAGGPDYLLQFLEPRTITENVQR